MSLKLEWDGTDDKAAAKEGWGLFECSGSSAEQGPWQIQRIDCPKEGEDHLLTTDSDAWVLVINGEEQHHIRAVRWLKVKNPKEYKRMVDHTRNSEKDTISSESSVPLPFGIVGLPLERVTALIKMDKRGWPERKYMCWCCHCDQMFTGHKRQVGCRVCEEAATAAKTCPTCGHTDA
jgi:hypothetical protein